MDEWQIVVLKCIKLSIEFHVSQIIRLMDNLQD